MNTSPAPRADIQTIFIIDDHDIVRFGLATLLKSCEQFKVAGTASQLGLGVQAIADLKPDLVISNMSMNDSKGLDTVRAVVHAQQGRKVLIISMHDELIYAEQVIALGAHGYLMKESAQAHVIGASLAVLGGDTWVSQKVSTHLLNRIMKRSRHEPGLASGSPLSVREVEVFEKIGMGKTTKEIAFDLHLSPRTVDIHRANIKRKLGLKSGAEVVAFAVSRT
ncbi:MAG: response regulator [Burkholderiaceae bacterium]